tara:strand:+ start:11539 stop:11883 length:345 start_codon:yes stop_codon:yes gene_type:complete
MATRGLNKLMNKVASKQIQEELNVEKKVKTGNIIELIKIPKSLCEFLDKPYGVEISKFDLEKEIFDYITYNGLDIGNKRMFKADKKLAILLNVKEKDIVDQMNLKLIIKKLLLN